MKLKMLTAAVATALLSTSAMAVDFNGYFRAGIGQNVDGGRQLCAQANGAPVKYRLGNECESYLELGLGQDLYEKDGEKFRLNTMIAAKAGDGADWQDTRNGGHADQLEGAEPWGNAAFAFRQANIEYTNESGTTIWAGKKYYQRHDIHWLDFYYWNTSGYGGGVENLTISEDLGKVSLAWLRVINNQGIDDDKFVSANNIDLRWSGINMWKNASLELGLNYYMPSLTTAQEDAKVADDAGIMLTAEYTQGGILGGFNKFAVQLATGVATNEMMSNHSGSAFQSGWMNETDDASGFRIIDWGVVQFGDKIEMGYNAIYASADLDTSGGEDQEWLSIGVRPVYKWSDTQKTILEIGYDDTSVWGSDETLTKATIAQAFTAGSSFWARPEIRAYATYAVSDNDDKFGTNEDTNLSIGLQAEAWW